MNGEVSRRHEISDTAANHPVSGGILTFRKQLPSPHLLNGRKNRLRIQETRSEELHGFPDFPGCPDWAKPMMFTEYQVSCDVISFQCEICSKSSAAAGRAPCRLAKLNIQLPSPRTFGGSASILARFYGRTLEEYSMCC